MARRLKHWGWGWEDERPSPRELRALATFVSERLGFPALEPEAPVPLRESALAPPRLRVPEALRSFSFADDYKRALHSYGRSYSDLVRAFRGRFDSPPDVVVRPRDERELESALEWALGAGAAVIPFGGGTSVVGGVEPDVGEGFSGTVTIDTRRLDRVLEIDHVSRAARIQAGATGPALEQQLSAHGLTLRHFPQSYEFSTLGGWIATRAAGHFATLATHIDDDVESVRALTPVGWWESRRLPASGAGISPDRMLLGSEGTLGVITDAWVRVRRPPRFRAAAAVHFHTFEAGTEAVRAVAQSGLHPANCRLIDATEAELTGAGDRGRALLVLGFESTDYDVERWLVLALRHCEDRGGTSDVWRDGPRPHAADTWRAAFLRAPYLRDDLISIGVLCETFESAITWDRFAAFDAAVREQVGEAIRRVSGAPGVLTRRLTHVYPDGAAPYYTVLAPAGRGAEGQQWEEIKRAAAEAVIAAGGTITHHHAVGRVHRPWYQRQRPAPFAVALQAAKAALDPAGALNPGVLIERTGAE